ncbi:MAG TPA: hypothetical protein VGQ83_33615 [Polyangia bacterium]
MRALLAATLTAALACGTASPGAAPDAGADAGPPDLQITVDGPGLVRSEPAAIDCPGACAATLGTGAAVTVIAAPLPGAYFTGWSGDCAAAGRALRAGATTPAACTATFALAARGWARSYGGATYDWAQALDATTDGGYVIAGYTGSFGAGERDAWIVKLDGDGQIEWQRTYGGPAADEARAVRQTPDGGYLVAGLTASFGAGATDVWVLKLDGAGVIEWQRTYGGAAADQANGLALLPGGGALVVGQTESFGAGDRDGWVLQIDAQGEVVWQRTYGGAGMDTASAVVALADGALVVGSAKSFTADGLPDVWVMRLDAAGVPRWQETLGGDNFDYGYAVAPTADGGFVVCGWTASFGASVTDAWVLKLTAAGAVEWQRAYRGDDVDAAEAVVPLPDGGYLLAGVTWSFGAGGKDFWLLRLDPAGDIVWQKTYGGPVWDWAHALQAGRDDTFVAAGHSMSFGPGEYAMWVVKVDGDGACGTADGALGQVTTAVAVETGAAAVPVAATVGTTTVSAAPSTAAGEPSTASAITQYP